MIPRLLGPLAEGSVTPTAWNALWRDTPGANPFTRHEWLCALEASGCAVEEAGWLPNPRQFLNPHANRRPTPSRHPVEMELAVVTKRGPDKYLSMTSAPAPVPPTIPLPEFRLQTVEPLRSASPPTKPLRGRA